MNATFDVKELDTPKGQAAIKAADAIILDCITGSTPLCIWADRSKKHVPLSKFNFLRIYGEFWEHADELAKAIVEIEAAKGFEILNWSK